LKCPPGGWSPTYENSKGVPEVIEGVGIESGCPERYITPQSLWLLSLFRSSQFAIAGRNAPVLQAAVLFGPDVAVWPCWWADAMEEIVCAVNEANLAEMRG
jgi:hypothetical protein